MAKKDRVMINGRLQDIAADDFKKLQKEGNEITILRKEKEILERKLQEFAKHNEALMAENDALAKQASDLEGLVSSKNEKIALLEEHIEVLSEPPVDESQSGSEK